MPTANDLRGFQRIQSSVQSDLTSKVVAERPKFPEDMRKRFPKLAVFEEDEKKWLTKLARAIKGGAE